MKNKNIIESFNNAINGIIYTIRNERNMKIHVVVAFAILLLSLFYKLTRVEFLLVCFAISFVIACELFNTAMEALVDIIVDVYHPKAKIIKDVSAGAVFISTLLSIVVGYFTFFDRVSIDIEIVIKRLQQSPVHITVTALVITIISVFALKTFFKKGSPMHGGMPSGHAAISFSIATAISLMTVDARVALLCMVAALMVVQSRLEAKIHSVLELTVGGLLGFLVTLLVFQIFYK